MTIFSLEPGDVLFLVIGLLIGLLSVIIGFLNLYPKTYKKILSWSNRAKGIKTEITPLTLKMGKIGGIIGIIFGIIIFFLTFFALFLQYS